MAKPHCYPSLSISTHHNTSLLLDSLYCFEDEIEDGHSNSQPKFQPFSINLNINSPNSVFLSDWEDDELVSLFSKENGNKLHNTLPHNPSLAAARSKAVHWILKVNSHYSFSAHTAVLAVDYVDRFLSTPHFHIEKPWMTHLTAIASLSLAAKVEETQVPLLLDLQVHLNPHLFSQFYLEIYLIGFVLLISARWRKMSTFSKLKPLQEWKFLFSLHLFGE